jgi:hypothetical protein
MTVQEEVNRLKDEAMKKAREAECILELQKRFPDLKQHRNRWNTVRFYSASVNADVEKASIGHNCGCCPDSPLEVWPYIETEFGKVHSDPPVFTVGEGSWGGGDVAYDDWESKMKEAGIHEGVIQMVRNHFQEYGYDPYADDDEDD